MSLMICGSTVLIMSSLSWADSLNASGVHLSNFSEYRRTATSPSDRIEAMTYLVVNRVTAGPVLPLTSLTTPAASTADADVLLGFASPVLR